MNTLLAWYWAKVELHPLWRKFSFRLHKDELRTLKLAKAYPPQSASTISRTTIFWWCVLCLPALILLIIGVILAWTEHKQISLAGRLLCALAAACGLVLQSFHGIWARRWQEIAAELQSGIGPTPMTDSKETRLTTAIAAEEAARRGA